MNRDGSFDIKFEDGESKRNVDPDRVRSLETGRDRDSGRESSSQIREGEKVEEEEKKTVQKEEG